VLASVGARPELPLVIFEGEPVSRWRERLVGALDTSVATRFVGSRLEGTALRFIGIVWEGLVVERCDVEVLGFQGLRVTVESVVEKCRMRVRREGII